MISRIDHIAIAVRDYKNAYKFFTGILGAIPGSNSEDGKMKYLWQLFTLGDLSRLELLTPTGSGGFLENFLSSKEGGFHHMTLQTPDIKKAAETLDSLGIPYFGFREYGELWKELFIHPRDAFGVLIQIAQFRPDDWLPAGVPFPREKKFSIKKNDEGCTVQFAHPGGGKAQIDLTRGETEELLQELKKSL